MRRFLPGAHLASANNLSDCVKCDFVISAKLVIKFRTSIEKSLLIYTHIKNTMDGVE